MRIHDQLHPQAQTPAGEIHDEQRAGELHYFAGEGRDCVSLCAVLFMLCKYIFTTFLLSMGENVTLMQLIQVWDVSSAFPHSLLYRYCYHGDCLY